MKVLITGANGFIAKNLIEKSNTHILLSQPYWFLIQWPAVTIISSATKNPVQDAAAICFENLASEQTPPLCKLFPTISYPSLFSITLLPAIIAAVESASSW